MIFFSLAALGGAFVLAVGAAMDAGGGLGNVAAGPAIGTELVLRQANRCDEVVEALVGERSEAQAVLDAGDHVLERLAIRILVLGDVGVVPFQFADPAAGGEVHFGLGTREIQEAALVKERRTGNPHVDFLGALVVKALRLLAELGAADNRVVAEDEALAADEAGNRDELHLGDQVALLLVRWHERARPDRPDE